MESKEIIFFDGVCNLCNGAVNFIIDRDRHGRFLFASLQSGLAKDKLDPTGVDVSKLDSIVLLKKDGTVREKSSAVLHIAKRLGGGWPLMYVFMLLPKPIRDLAYDFIARNRYKWFGRQDQCRMPTPELRQRFLDAQY
ncbi:MAG: thiol-disulfide oxidoreductase DCC family protein [Cytophagales bacterium]|nr:thiol-disulfide oxidoreductase DCC family protein [Cytophagales bacterium]